MSGAGAAEEGNLLGAPSAAELVLAQEARARAQLLQGAASAVALQVVARAEENAQAMGEQLDEANTRAGRADVEAAGYKRWAGIRVAQVGHASQQLGGAMARIGELEVRIVDLETALSDAHSKAELAVVRRNAVVPQMGKERRLHSYLVQQT